MGQKVCPIGVRLGITQDWRSRWYADKKSFGRYLVEDQKIRRFIKANYKFAGISKIEIERTKDNVAVILHAARPGVIIGKRGSRVEELEGQLKAIANGEVSLKIIEVGKPELDAQLVAEGISEQLLKRAAFRRTMKKAIEVCTLAGAKGVKIVINGRLGGADMARQAKDIQGGLPLSTLRAHISYGFAEAHTTYGAIGVKVWIYTGMKISEREAKRDGLDTQTNEVQEESARPDKGSRNSWK